MPGTVVELRIAPESFALGHTLETVPELDCEVERIVAADPEDVMPFLWVEAPSHAIGTLEEAFAADETVDEVECITDLDGERLYRMRWVGKIDLLVRALIEEDGTILSASGSREGWEVRLLFPSREALSRTDEYRRAKDIEWTIRTIYDVDEGRQARYGLTDDQRETMQGAFESGYYEIPRRITLQDLAAEFDVSHQGLSERLRRGHEALVRNTVVIGPREDDDREIQVR